MNKSTRIISFLASSRQMQGIGTKGLSEKLGYSHATIKNSEEQRTQPSMGALFAWADSMGIELTIEADQTIQASSNKE